jgi:hypothetical protein
MFRDLFIGANQKIRNRYQHIMHQQDLENLINNELTEKLKKVIEIAYESEFKHLAMSVYNCELGVANF